jgi:hypothetical protein
MMFDVTFNLADTPDQQVQEVFHKSGSEMKDLLTGNEVVNYAEISVTGPGRSSSWTAHTIDNGIWRVITATGRNIHPIQTVRTNQLYNTFKTIFPGSVGGKKKYTQRNRRAKKTRRMRKIH